LPPSPYFLAGLLKKLKSINHRGAQASRNSPVSLSRFIGSYFSAVARLQRWLIHKGHKDLKYRILPLCTLCLPCLPAGRFVFFVVKKNFFNNPVGGPMERKLMLILPPVKGIENGNISI
jgi:hypothetical protein